MKEKIKWFGRYLGSKCSIQGEPNCFELTGVDVDDNYAWAYFKHLDSQLLADCDLVLKELKDISDEDIACLNNISMKICGVSNCHTKGWMNKNGLFSVLEIDFLRSKGYAIGIPKEYYITESELKEE